jgi:hypothetical protein
MKNLIGRKVKGFKFEDGKYSCLRYSDAMDKHIGEIGVINTYNDGTGNFEVHFKDDFFYYPGELIEAHLVDEWVIGEEYEFSDSGNDWCKRKLLAVLPERFREAKMFIVQMGHLENDWSCYQHIRPIESNREVKEQIAKLEEELNKLKAKL